MDTGADFMMGSFMDLLTMVQDPNTFVNSR